MCRNSSKTTEGCASALTSPIRSCSVNCLHKHVRLNWTTTHCRCMESSRFYERSVKWHNIQLNIYGTSLDDMLGRGMMSITMYHERALHKKCNQIPMAVAQRLILSMMRRCVEACWGLTKVIPDTE